MAWEYLENDHMDERFRVAVAELTRLGVDWPRAFVLDLNCGFSARLLLVLPAVRMYVGNDIALTEMPASATARTREQGNVSLIAYADYEVPAMLTEVPTVLCCFGFSTGDKHLSYTLEDTYRSYLRDGVPFAVLGKPVRWLKPPWEEMVAWPEWAGYDCNDFDVHPLAAECLEWRRVRVAKRKG